MAKYKLIKHLHYDYKIKNKNVVIDIDVDLTRFNQQYGRAQYELDSLVMDSMVHFMPMETAQFIDNTRILSQAIAGSGKVYAAAPPFGRYLYFGNVMVDEETGSPYAREAARKVLVSQYGGKTNAREKIEYSKAAHPRVSEQWFEEAKKTDGHMWVQKVKQIAGGGKRG